MSYFLHLQKDKKLVPFLKTSFPPLKFRNNIPLRLMASIMSQQLSSRVADVIYKRFLQLFDGKEPTAEQVLAVPKETLRSIGLSNAKTSYIHNVALFCIEKNIDDKMLKALPNEEIIELLTQIKGVGRWTVEMLLMFSLGREDVFAADDLALQQAMMHAYKWKDLDKKILRQKMLKQSEKWKPYRTYACLHLWHWKDNAADL
ncbi:3-methyladenine DNA glycosylase [Arachidicoccus ginsenosidimutans]|uniref:DNA-3-methyladenine glycosylase family protein n=1 Tax=Arachidicoccus sp. BS20 TaxID=1850526 RepID=UPI0007F0DF21|nr:DNA-3-methyladenine glycosylase [Arachidicoccus sp. BS20]ANI89537.1 3-methyladenine DNA glycosylase [Arachidicoccus sp. BS20]